MSDSRRARTSSPGGLRTSFDISRRGAEINPAAITPVLERVFADTWQADLFRLASLTWSVPVSNGFGRRLRYLVWDAHNEKLISLIVIGDPVFNLFVRDNLIGWNVGDRGARLIRNGAQTSVDNVDAKATAA